MGNRYELSTGAACGVLFTFFVLFIAVLVYITSPREQRSDVLERQCTLVGVHRTGEYRSGRYVSKRHETIKQYLCPNEGVQVVVVWE